jgi:predicted RNA-binding Zn-ribbon protein involved in translation (DUF1610 family)
MSEPRPTVAEVFRQHEQEFLQRWGHTLSDRPLQTLRDLGACRTAALGAHLHQCTDCQGEVMVYNSCLNRHCPQCGSTARDRWLAARSEELLPVPYCHVVFTLPHELIALALQNPRVVYGLLFRAASQTLLTIAADPKHLGARLGFLAVLHTWNQHLAAPSAPPLPGARRRLGLRPDPLDRLPPSALLPSREGAGGEVPGPVSRPAAPSLSPRPVTALRLPRALGRSGKPLIASPGVCNKSRGWFTPRSRLPDHNT